MRPENALSPRKRLDASSLDVIYRSPVNERGRSWSLAKMTWDGVPDRVGCRWDGLIAWGVAGTASATMPRTRETRAATARARGLSCLMRSAVQSHIC
jgi:hypothetical protein